MNVYKKVRAFYKRFNVNIPEDLALERFRNLVLNSIRDIILPLFDDNQFLNSYFDILALPKYDKPLIIKQSPLISITVMNHELSGKSIVLKDTKIGQLLLEKKI